MKIFTINSKKEEDDNSYAWNKKGSEMKKFYIVNLGNLETKKFDTFKSAKNFMLLIDVDCSLELYNKNGKFVKLISFVSDGKYCKL